MTQKPTIVIRVSNGDVEYQVMPFGAKVDVVLIDDDELYDGVEIQELEDLVKKTKLLPGKSLIDKKYRQELLSDLKELIKDAEQWDEEFAKDEKQRDREITLRIKRRQSWLKNQQNGKYTKKDKN